MMLSRRQHGHTAFSLIEVTAVLVLLGLMAVGTVQLYHVKAHDAHLDDVTGRLALIDAQARQTVWRTGQTATIEFDLNASTVTLVDEAAEHNRMPFTLPSSMKIDRVETPRSRGSYGKISVLFTAPDVSPSYVVKIKSLDGTSKTNLVAGLTGQVTEYDNEDGWNEASATLSSLDVD